MYVVAAAALALWFAWLDVMPGKSFEGPLPPLDARQTRVASELRADVKELAGTIGERNVARRKEALETAAGFCEAQLASTGMKTRRQSYDANGTPCANVEAEKKGATRSNEIIVVGAHYDTVPGAPGADDNGSGVAALLALAREAAVKPPLARTLRFVAFANEEQPWFQTAAMGSLAYAKECRARGDDVVAMISLETMGFFADGKGSQRYPFPLSAFYPSEGDFIGFVGNTSSRALVHEVTGSFRAHAQFPSQGGVYPAFLPGIAWSDQWAFWQEGYRAMMVTDTAPFRYPHYHTASDTPDKLDYDRLARVVVGLSAVLDDLAGGTATR